MPVMKPMTVPMIVLAMENALLLLKNETKKSTSAVLENVESSISPSTFNSAIPPSSVPPLLRIYSSQSTSVTRHMMTPMMNALRMYPPAMLARESGRLIYPLAIESNRRLVLPSWDRASVDLPFARIAFVAGEPIHVPRDADDAALESARQLLQSRLDAAHRRAAALAHRKEG